MEYTVTLSKRCSAIGVEKAMIPVFPKGNKKWRLVSVLIVWGDTFAFYWERIKE